MERAPEASSLTHVFLSAEDLIGIAEEACGRTPAVRRREQRTAWLACELLLPDVS
ncbi:hypothetical protein [Streptomyces sp. NPDC096030]|uniref:hypothetical protein n=1 Tax=Streptomyces sp. NPDC096030 TaxID=3155423 RepID=UPI00331E9BAA